MHLYLSKSKPWRTEYSTDGVVLYKADSPRFSWGGERISVMKPKVQRSGAGAQYPYQDPYQNQNQNQNQDSYSYLRLAEIEFHSGRVFKKESRIKIGDRNMAAKDVLKMAHAKFGASEYGERHFVGPDGKTYVWKMGSDKCRLHLRGSAMPIATFHSQRLGYVSQPASLEILPPGHHMLDEIITTFIYMERLRTHKARARCLAKS